MSTPASALHDFVSDQEMMSLDAEVDAILNHPDLLTQMQLVNLSVILQERMPEGVKYDASFDLMAEVAAQLTMCKAMRDKVMSRSGTPMEGVSARDLKEVATANNSLFQSVMRNHEKLVNMNRLQAIEKATVTAIKEMPKEVQDAFMEALERQLEAIN